jgi:hypothetical protein
VESHDRAAQHTIMKWNREEVARLLNAKITDAPLEDGRQVTLVRFEDARMQYELHIIEDGVFLAADPERPIQGLPFFEISLPCTEIAPLPRSGMPTGIGMFSGPINSTTIRFSITRREDGSISLSGVWPGLTAPHTGATPTSNATVP